MTAAAAAPLLLPVTAWCCALSARLSGAELRTFAQRHKGFRPVRPAAELTHKPLIASFARLRIEEADFDRHPVVRTSGRPALIS